MRWVLADASATQPVELGTSACLHTRTSLHHVHTVTTEQSTTSLSPRQMLSSTAATIEYLLFKSPKPSKPETSRATLCNPSLFLPSDKTTQHNISPYMAMCRIANLASTCRGLEIQHMADVCSAKSESRSSCTTDRHTATLNASSPASTPR
jgi:hypothetical protein